MKNYSEKAEGADPVLKREWDRAKIKLIEGIVTAREVGMTVGEVIKVVRETFFPSKNSLVEFPVQCGKCHWPSDSVLGPADSVSHKPGCSNIGNDPRHNIWLENSYRAGTLQRPPLCVYHSVYKECRSCGKTMQPNENRTCQAVVDLANQKERS